jgi:divalent metal cation (Fe/Co/Zn/Cd) transporter
VDDDRRDHVGAGFWVSVQSVVWTVVASAAVVVVGVRSHTTVLVALGAVGFVDAIGSATLAHHFRHARRRDELSDRLERVSHMVVLIGLAVVGASAIVGGAIRLITRGTGTTPVAGIAVAGASFVVLVALSIRKVRIARSVHSPALRSDGHLSGIGAAQAAIAVVGTILARWFGLHWADAAATLAVGAFAVSLSVWTWVTR